MTVDMLGCLTRMPNQGALQQCCALMISECNDTKVSCSRALYASTLSERLQWIDEMTIHEDAVTSLFKTLFEWQTRFGGQEFHPISHKQHAALLKQLLIIGQETGRWRGSVLTKIQEAEL